MKKQEIQAVTALSLILSIGTAGHLYAGSPGQNRRLSENCEQAEKTRDSMTRSLPRILCEQERKYESVFGGIIRNTGNLKGETYSGLGEKKDAEMPRPEKPPSTEPKPTVKVEQSKSVVPDKSKKTNGSQRPPVSLTAADFFPGQRIDQLSLAQRKVLRRNLEKLLNRIDVIAFLNAIQRAEWGAKLRIVGGTRGKSAECQRRIKNLDSSAHPKEQGLPNRCFLTTSKYGLSTAAGLYQIVYYRNWRALHKLLGLKDFSERSQAIVALEIMRSSAVKNGKVGEGLVALLKGDLEGAVKKGSDPWASSPYSRWRGKRPSPLLQYAQQELKKMRDRNGYAVSQLERFKPEANS
jgi:muramidase (phage lysozyme)